MVFIVRDENGKGVEATQVINDLKTRKIEEMLGKNGMTVTDLRGWEHSCLHQCSAAMIFGHLREFVVTQRGIT